jgi:predicted N-acetyltransferase YhbS
MTAMPVQDTSARVGSIATPIVRDADRADWADIREVVQGAHSPFASQFPPTIFARYLDDLLDVDAHARRGQLLVAEVDGQVRATAAFYPNTYNQAMGWPRGWASGRGLAVHPEAAHHGLARALVEEGERRARVHGARVFASHTATFMIDEIALYERLGYCRAPHFDLDITARYGLSMSRPVMGVAFRRNLRERGPCPGAGEPRLDQYKQQIARSGRRPSTPGTARLR